jgi:membrane-associated phospholipid phosphatase
MKTAPIEPESPAGGSPATAPAKKAPVRTVWIFWLIGSAIVVAGFCGLDRVFYEQVSLRLETPLRGDLDFYTATRAFWLTCRYGFGHVFGIALAYFAVLALHSGGWRAANAALAGVIAAAAVANLAQGAIGRLRPNQAESHLAFTQPTLNPLEKKEVSFPSGEAATGFALAVVLSRLAPRWKPAFYAAGTLAGVSRLINGAHYLSDVAAGAMLGVLVGGAVFRFVDTYHDRLWPRRRGRGSD